jgi:RNA-binding protein with serine-rich domain 1
MFRRSRSSSTSSSSSSASSSSGSSTSSATTSASSPRSPRGKKSPARGNRSPARRSASPRKDKKRSISPVKKEPEPQTKITVRNLSRNVSKDHVNEIFGIYGTVKEIRLPTNYFHPNFCRGDATVIYEKHDDAEKALRHMDGGQIDGLVVTCEWVPQTPPRASHRGRSPVRGRSPRRRSPVRGRSPRRSPPRRAFGGRRSRSPIRRSRSPIRGRSPPKRFRRSPSPGRRSPRRSSPRRRSPPPPRRGTGGNMIPLGTRRRSPSP